LAVNFLVLVPGLRPLFDNLGRLTVANLVDESKRLGAAGAFMGETFVRPAIHPGEYLRILGFGIQLMVPLWVPVPAALSLN
jgi:hypothetical protein